MNLQFPLLIPFQTHSMKTVHFSFIFSVFTPPLITAGVDAHEVKKGVMETVIEAVMGDCTPIIISVI